MSHQYNIVYTPNDEPFDPRILSRINPTTAALKHFSNLLYLQFLANNSDLPHERHQANKEMLIAEKRISYWKRHYSFNQEYYLQETTNIKKLWMGKRSRPMDITQKD